MSGKVDVNLYINVFAPEIFHYVLPNANSNSKTINLTYVMCLCTTHHKTP